MQTLTLTMSTYYININTKIALINKLVNPVVPHLFISIHATRIASMSDIFWNESVNEARVRGLVSQSDAIVPRCVSGSFACRSNPKFGAVGHVYASRPTATSGHRGTLSLVLGISRGHPRRSPFF